MILGRIMNVVDSSGWIEFFTAGRNGPAFRAVIAERAARAILGRRCGGY